MLEGPTGGAWYRDYILCCGSDLTQNIAGRRFFLRLSQFALDNCTNVQYIVRALGKGISENLACQPEKRNSLMERYHIAVDSAAAELSEDYNHPVGAFVEDTGNNEYYTYLNAATCPDCGAAMVCLGRCFTCMSCGFASCGA